MPVEEILGRDQAATPAIRSRPVVVQRGIHSDQIYYLEEHQLEFPGVQLAESYLRSYPYQSLAAQVLGYVGQISPSRVKAR